MITGSYRERWWRRGGVQLTIQFPPLPSSQSVGITGNETPNNRLIWSQVVVWISPNHHQKQ